MLTVRAPLWETAGARRIERNFSTVSGLTFRVLFRILNPIVIVAF